VRRKQTATRERRSRVKTNAFPRSFHRLGTASFANEVLAPALRRQLASCFHDRARHTGRRPILVRVDDVGKRLLHAHITRENESRSDAVPLRRLVDLAHQVFVGAQEPRQRPDLREIRNVILGEARVEERVGHRPLVDDLELAVVRGLVDATADLVGDLVPDLTVRALERRDQQPLLCELLGSLRRRNVWRNDRGGRNGDRSSPAAHRTNDGTRHYANSSDWTKPPRTRAGLMLIRL